MKKYDEIHDPVSCLNKAALDEPLFVLRAKDRLAPSVVRVWAVLARLSGAHDGKTNNAEQVARDMEDWADGVRAKSKIPD